MPERHQQKSWLRKFVRNSPILFPIAKRLLPAHRFMTGLPWIARWAARGSPSYDGDLMTVWDRNLEFLHDEKFRAAYRAGMDTDHKIMRPKGSKKDLLIQYRVAVCLWAARHGSHLPGAFVECGVNTGIFSLAICKYLDFNTLDKDFYLFDTYEGIPTDQINEAEHRLGREEESLDRYEECYEGVVRTFAPYPRVRPIRGKVPDTLSLVDIDRVAYLSIDMNVAYPERAALEYFWPKLSPGACVLLDDYGCMPFREQKYVIDEFTRAQGCEVWLLPTGQGLLIRP